jgi:hypothetical protein
LRKKEKTDYLERLRQLNIYSYGLKFDIIDTDEEEHKRLKYRHMLQQQTGFLSEEIAQVFPNCVDNYRSLPVEDTKEVREMCGRFKPTKAEAAKAPYMGINYNALLCYTILAIQELAERVAKLENKSIK